MIPPLRKRCVGADPRIGPQQVMPLETLPSGTVHVWQAVIPAADLTGLAVLLTDDEQSRAARYIRERDRQRYITTRGHLRMLLGGYLQRSPASIRFAYTAQGKPYLESAGGLVFNISHTDDLALYAFARNTDIGVDVEVIKTDFPADDIARHYFSPVEQAALRRLPAAQKPAGFFNCWTRKEAYIKAVGLGLSLALDSFDVTLTPGQPARLLATRSHPVPAGAWSLFDLQPAPGYAGALIVRGSGWVVERRRYP